MIYLFFFIVGVVVAFASMVVFAKFYLAKHKKNDRKEVKK